MNLEYPIQAFPAKSQKVPREPVLAAAVDCDSPRQPKAALFAQP